MSRTSQHPALTQGFLHNLVLNAPDDQSLPPNPIVQVVGVKRFSRDGDPERYRVAISDGLHYYSSVMLTTQCSNVVKTNVILKAIIQLVNYSCPFRLQGRKVIVIRELKILKMAHDIPGMIGNPIPLMDHVSDQDSTSLIPPSSPDLTTMWSASFPVSVPQDMGTSTTLAAPLSAASAELITPRSSTTITTASAPSPNSSVIVSSPSTSSTTQVTPDIVSGSAILASLAASCTTPASSVVVPVTDSGSESNTTSSTQAPSSPISITNTEPTISRKRDQPSCSKYSEDFDEAARKKTAAVSSLCRCSVCFEIFNDPKSLNCEHHFCKECLEELVQFDNGLPYIKCPLCSLEHRFRNNFLTVSTLKCQLFLKQVLETVKDDSKPVDEPLPKCCGKSASWFCGDCTKYLCEDCTLGTVKRHGDCGAICIYIRYHPGKSAVLPFCLQHNSFVYYGCMTCQTVVCPYCKQSNHRFHDIRSFNEYADQVKTDLTQLIEATKIYNQQVEGLLQQSSQQDVSACIAERAKTIREKCISFIDSVEEKLTEEAVRSQEKETSMWKSKLRINEDFLSEGQSLLTKEKTDLVCSRDKVLKQIPESSITSDGVKIDSEVELKGFEDIFKGICGVFEGMSVPHMDAKGNITNKSYDLGNLGSGIWQKSSWYNGRTDGQS